MVAIFQVCVLRMVMEKVELLEKQPLKREKRIPFLSAMPVILFKKFQDTGII